MARRSHRSMGPVRGSVAERVPTPCCRAAHLSSRTEVRAVGKGWGTERVGSSLVGRARIFRGRKLRSRPATRPRRPRRQDERARNKAFEWLEDHGTTDEAGFVLPPLLERDDLDDFESLSARRWSVKWLRSHCFERDAEFVLRSLLARPDLLDRERVWLVRVALPRLKRVIGTDEATFLLRTLLSVRELPRDLENDLLAIGLDWCRSNPDHKSLDYVLKRLLRRPTTPDGNWQQAANLALNWLRKKPQDAYRDHLLSSLWTRADLLVPEERSYLLRDSGSWIKNFSPDEHSRLCRQIAEAATEEELMAIDLKMRHSPYGSCSLSDALLDALNSDDDSALERIDLEEAIEECEARLSVHNPGSAAYYLTGLLPTTLRLGAEDAHRRSIRLTERMLQHPSLTIRQRDGFLRAVQRSIDQGYWPDRHSGEQVLAQLGLK